MFPIFAGNSASTGYNLTRSLRLRQSATAYLSRTPATTGNRRTFTFSTWLKRGRFATGTEQVLIAATNPSTSFSEINFAASSDILRVNLASGVAAYYFDTSMVFRDPSAWYHLVVAVDTTQASSSNWIKTYVNGSQVVGTLVGSFQNYDTDFNTVSRPNSIGGRPNLNTWFYDGYQTEIYWIDGQALTPSSFGSTNALTGVWQPARYTGSYGTNGFYLPFTDNSALTTSSNVGLGKDFSGNGNYWTTNNISLTSGVTYDSMTDVPTLTSATAANFATWNPLDFAGSPTFSNGNLYVAGAFRTRSTMALPTGVKTYVEIYQTGTASTVDVFCGLLSSSAVFPGAHANPGVNWYATDTIYGQLNGSAAFSFAGTLAGGAILQLAYDGSTGKVWLGINNTWYTSAGATSGNPSAGTGEFATLSTSTSWSVYCGSSTGAQTITAKFGQNGQSYTPPTGFVALNTYNLPTSTIVKGNTVMDATTYTGTLLSNAITNAAAFKPDLVWVKSRSAATDNKLTDSVRGVTKGLISNTTAAETTDTQGLTAFNTNGFTVGTNTDYNNLAATYVAWQWQAGQGLTSSNTNGTITSTVSVNASAGFSIATFTTSGGYSTGTVGHGLGVAPAMYIVKNRNGSAIHWNTYHQSLGNTQALYLDLTNAAATSSAFWNNTSPTSSVFSIGTNLYASQDYVAYCWTPIAGYSAFGSFSGNGLTDGTFIYTGFLPRFVMVKRTSSADDWRILDTARNTYNVMNLELYPNAASAETTVTDFDVLSNGIKLRNLFSGTYIYAAFATNPFKNSLAF